MCSFQVQFGVLAKPPEILAARMPRLGVVEDCALCEMHNGEADGLTWQEYDANYGRFDITAEPSRPFAPGVESWTDAMTRVNRRAMDSRAADRPRLWTSSQWDAWM